jgi:hypothetical protein
MATAESILMRTQRKRTVGDPYGTVVSSMDTPRPQLVVNGPIGSSARNIAWNRHVATLLAIPPHELAQIRTILANHRRRQTRKLGKRDEDPDPYASSYIFYCLEGRREI